MTMTLEGVRVSLTHRLFFTHGKVPLPIVQAAGWAPGPVWTDAENLAPTGFDPRTVESVVSRYTDYAIRPTSLWYWTINECGMRYTWLLSGGNEGNHENTSVLQVSGPTFGTWTFCTLSCIFMWPPRSVFRRQTTSFEWRHTVRPALWHTSIHLQTCRGRAVFYRCLLWHSSVQWVPGVFPG
jgi:hypothetical protein